MSPSEALAAEIVRGITITLAQFGIAPDPQYIHLLEQETARAIQQVADDQAHQSDAQVFGDDIDVTVTGYKPCDYCQSPGSTVAWGPMLPPSGGRN